MQVPAELLEAEAQLQQQIAQAREELTRGLVPEEAQKLLQRLEDAGNAAASPGLSQAQALPRPEELQGIAKARALKATVDHFAGHKAELDKARAELDKYKGSFEKVESVKDMPWPERVVLGTQWQLGRLERFTVGLGPYAAWRFTDRFSVGAGAQYRHSVSLKEKPWVSGADRVLGFFAFADAEVGDRAGVGERPVGAWAGPTPSTKASRALAARIDLVSRHSS